MEKQLSRRQIGSASTWHCKYTWLVRDIHTHIIEGYAIRKDLLKEKAQKQAQATQATQISKGKPMIKYEARAQPNQSKPEHTWEKLRFCPEPRSTPCKPKSVQAHWCESLDEFLQRNAWRSLEEGEFGISWVELFVLYKKLGYPNPIKEGSGKAKVRASLAKQLHAFKVGVRRFAKEWVEDERQKSLFSAGKAKGYVWKHLGIASHITHLNAAIRLSESARKDIEQDLLYLNGNKVKDHGREVRSGATIRLSKLSLKGKTVWTQRVKSFTQVQLEEFPGVGSFKLQTCRAEGPERAGRGKKRGVAEVGRCAPRPPGHDFVQPLCVHAKKPCTTPVPVLRIGMLSSGLKKRFGHLCTASV